MQTNPWQAHRVLQNVDSSLGVEAFHLFQRIEAGSDIKIVVIAQPVFEGAHALFFEQLLAPLPLLPFENISALQLRIPGLIFWEPREIELFGRVEPFVREPGFLGLASVGFHPFRVARARAQVVDDIEETGPPGE